jgi:hypothetical protein
MANDRRGSPRIEILERIHGHIASIDTDVRVREMSLGGMGIETDFPFPVGAIHEFRLRLGDDSTVLLRGKILRCREQTNDDGVQTFVSGVQFLDEDPPGDSPVGGLIEKIT